MASYLHPSGIVLLRSCTLSFLLVSPEQPTLTFSLATHPLLSFLLSKLEPLLTFFILHLVTPTLAWQDLHSWVKGHCSMLMSFANTVQVSERWPLSFPWSFSFKASALKSALILGPWLTSLCLGIHCMVLTLCCCKNCLLATKVM